MKLMRQARALSRSPARPTRERAAPSRERAAPSRTAALAAAVLAAGLLASPQAAAQIAVFGSSDAHECYLAAKSASARATARDEASCTRALREMQVLGRDLLATYNNRALVRMHRGNFALALADLDKALEIDAGSGETHLNRGAALIRLKRFGEADAALSRSIELGSSQTHKAFYNRGVAREAAGDASGAYADYLEASHLAPGWDLPVRAMERFEVRQGRDLTGG